MLAHRVMAVLSSATVAAESSPWSFGGHARTMYESYRGLDLGLGPVDDDDWIHQRVQAMAAWEPDEAFRFAAELTWGRMWGKESPLAPPDQDDLDLLQLVARVRHDDVSIQAGRQTLYYGSGRLLASREGANQRLSHDAVLLSWQGDGATRIDAFIASPVQVEPGAFDNVSRPDELRFWSLYAMLPAGKHLFADLYYIGLRDADSIFVPGGGREVRHTLGTRLWRDEGPLLLNSEVIVQFGDAGGRDILAGAASLGLGWAFHDLPGKPSLQLRADAISGGDATGSLHTFHPLFQANNYFNEGGFLSPSNLYNVNPLIELHPRENLTLRCGVNFQWRFDPDDAVYAPPLQPIGGPAPGGERYLGTAFNASLEWAVTPSTSVFLGYTHLDAGPSLTGIGGSDVDYLQSSIRWEF